MERDPTLYSNEIIESDSWLPAIHKLRFDSNLSAFGMASGVIVEFGSDDFRGEDIHKPALFRFEATDFVPSSAVSQSLIHRHDGIREVLAVVRQYNSESHDQKVARCTFSSEGVTLIAQARDVEESQKVAKNLQMVFGEKRPKIFGKTDVAAAESPAFDAVNVGYQGLSVINDPAISSKPGIEEPSSADKITDQDPENEPLAI